MTIRDDWSLRRKCVVAVSVPLVILVAASAGLGLLFNGQTNDAATVRHALVVQGQAVSVESLVVGAESGVQGYLLTGDTSYLTTYRRALSAVPAGLSTLSGMVVGDPVEVAQTKSIRVQATAALALLAQEAAMPQGAPLAPGQRAVLVRIHQMMDQLRSTFSALLAGSNRGLTTDRARIRGVDRLFVALALIGGPLGVAGVIGVAIALSRAVSSRARLVERAVLQVERGEALTDLPSGADEIGRIADGLAHASDLLGAQRHSLEQSQHFMEALLEHSPVTAWRLNLRSGEIFYITPNCIDSLGVEPRDALDSWHAITRQVDASDLQTFREEMARAEDARQRVSFPLRYRHPDGRLRWFQVDIIPVDEEPDGSDAICFFTDVTDLREARVRSGEHESLLAAVLDASPDMYVIRDIEGNVVGVYGAVEMMTGWDSEAFKAVAVDFRSVAPADQQLMRDAQAAAMAGRVDVPEVRVRVRTRDGGWSVLDSLSRPVTDAEHNIIGTLTANRDVTRRLGLERELEAARVQADRANKAKSEFLSRVSHELRTPLNAILGFTQILELDGLEGDQAEHVGYIRKAGTHLLDLINELLDISRIETGKMRFSMEPVAARAVVAEVAELMQPLARSHQVSLRVDPGGDESIVADTQRLRQVLLNLVGNGIVYNRPDGSVTLAIHRLSGPNGADDPHDGRVRIDVRDSGAGIAPELLDRLFVPFDRLGAEQSGVEGTGIGLALAERLTQSMGGTIRVASTPGAGSTFSVEFASASMPPPVTAPVPATGVAAPAGGHRSHPRLSAPITVLHIEDNPSNIQLMEQILRREDGVRLVTAGQGQLGLDLAREYRPDLVLLDLHLPDLPGEEMLRRLCSQPETAHTTVVVVSADASPGQVDHLLGLGASSYITKPFDIEVILGLVEHCRRNRHGGQ